MLDKNRIFYVVPYDAGEKFSPPFPIKFAYRRLLSMMLAQTFLNRPASVSCRSLNEKAILGQ